MSPRFDRHPAFAVAVRRLFRIGWFAPPSARASPVWLAFAAGQVRLASRSGLTQSKLSDSPPEGSHFCAPSVSASPGNALLALTRALRPPRCRSTSSKPPGSLFRGPSPPSVTGRPAPPMGQYPTSGGNRSPKLPFRVSSEQETLRASPVQSPRSGCLLGTTFRWFREGPLQAVPEP